MCSYGTLFIPAKREQNKLPLTVTGNMFVLEFHSALKHLHKQTDTCCVQKVKVPGRQAGSQWEKALNVHHNTLLHSAVPTNELKGLQVRYVGWRGWGPTCRAGRLLPGRPRYSHGDAGVLTYRPWLHLFNCCAIDKSFPPLTLVAAVGAWQITLILFLLLHNLPQFLHEQRFNQPQ